MSRRARLFPIVAVVVALAAPGAAAQTKTSLRLAGTMPEPEWRILGAVQAAALADPVLRIAVDTNGHITVAGLWFVSPQPAGYMWNLLQTVFAAVPALDEIDLTGVRFGDTPVAVNLMKVVFSAAASRDEFQRAAVATPLGDSVNGLPRLWSAPDSDQQTEPVGAPPTAPSPAAGDIYHGDESRRAAALTFDDGPFPIYTTLLLDTLGRLGAKATFFLVGQQVRAYPYLARAIASAGHEVGNHTFHHRNLTQLAPQQMFDEISRAQDTIATVTGQVPRYFRPPGGDYDVAVSHAAHQLGLMTVFWTANSADYTNTAPAALEARVLSEMSHGGILLFHQGMVNTIRILPHLVDTLRSRGYEISTVGDVVAHRVVSYDGRSSAAKSMNPRSTSVPTNSTPTRSPTSSP